MSDGLTLIIGDNGDGKTTFFEALQWLFNVTDIELTRPLSNFSAMRKSQMSIGEQEKVLVSLSFEHYGPKIIEKSFRVEKTGNEIDDFKISKIEFIGYEENGTERVPVDGKRMMNVYFDSFLQRFSMFKGESDLNVFNNPSAFQDLVKHYSDLGDFDKFIPMTEEFESKSLTAYTKENQSDNKIAKKSKELENQLLDVRRRISNVQKDIRDFEDSRQDYSKKIENLEKNKDASDRLKDINDRLEAKRLELSRIKGNISAINLNTSLLDRFWILCAYPSVLNELKDKAGAFSKTKRKQEADFLKEQAERNGKMKALRELQAAMDGKTELRWDIPDQQTMEEMISEHICKVCGTPAPEGSDAYKYMVHRLEEYKKHLEQTAPPVKEEDEKLFIKEYIEEIQTLYLQLSGHNASAISSKADEIKNRLEILSKMESQKRDIEQKISEIEDEKTRLLIQVDGVSEAELQKTFADYSGYHKQMSNAEQRLYDLKHELEDLKQEEQGYKDEIDGLASTGMAKVYRDIHVVMEYIRDAFKRAKDMNLTVFLENLQNTSNRYLSLLNAKDFHGIVKLIKTKQDSADIRLYSSSGEEIVKPSGSQLTTMYMSVLFAISELTTLKKDETYPMIFDAATSSFGDTKEDDFYNIVDSLGKQCIIVTKDFLSKGELRRDDINKLSCSVYRIKKQDGFDPEDLSTIRTTITKEK